MSCSCYSSSFLVGELLVSTPECSAMYFYSLLDADGLRQCVQLWFQSLGVLAVIKYGNERNEPLSFVTLRFLWTKCA